MSYRTIQRMLLPECETENHNLYYQASKGVVLADGTDRKLTIPGGEKVSFFTYFNGFFLKQWRTYTRLKNVRIRITGGGFLKLRFCHMTMTNQKETDLTVEWKPGSDTVMKVFEIPEWRYADAHACYLEIEGIEKGGLLLDFIAEGELENTAQIIPAAVICTYKREAAVRANIESIARLPEESRPQVYLVDNGNTLGEEAFPEFVHYVPNRNTGGTGGFTRGIMEVLADRKYRFTHVLLMDDDISLEPGVMEKTWNFLSCLKEEYTDAALAGALLRADTPWLQYECGALWNRGRIVAGKHHFDLRTQEALLKNMRREPVEYGGWWYGCFPLEQIRKKGLPLPLFVHRDDVEYGIRMGKTLTLNGIGVWHEAFEKKLPQTGEYYDIRNMAIVNAIHVPDWSAREWKWFLRKWVTGNVLRGRYEYVTLNIRGVFDFLKGEKWLKVQDAAALHRQISGMLAPLSGNVNLTEKRSGGYYCTDPGVSVYTAAVRKKIIYTDSQGNCLIAEKSIAKALKCYVLLAKAERKINRKFRQAAAEYRENYKELTMPDFWEKYIGDR